MILNSSYQLPLTHLSVQATLVLRSIHFTQEAPFRTGIVSGKPDPVSRLLEQSSAYLVHAGVAPHGASAIAMTDWTGGLNTHCDRRRETGFGNDRDR